MTEFLHMYIVACAARGMGRILPGAGLQRRADRRVAGFPCGRRSCSSIRGCSAPGRCRIGAYCRAACAPRAGERDLSETAVDAPSSAIADRGIVTVGGSVLWLSDLILRRLAASPPGEVHSPVTHPHAPKSFVVAWFAMQNRVSSSAAAAAALSETAMLTAQP